MVYTWPCKMGEFEDVPEELTFKWHAYNFHINWTISNKATVMKVMLLLHLCNKWISCVSETLLFNGGKYSESSAKARKVLFRLYSIENNNLLWYVDFKHGRTGTNDAECSYTNEAVTAGNIKKVLKIVMDDPKVKVCKIAEMVNISIRSASTISHEKLGMKKVFSKWVLHLLTMEQKQHRINDSESCLTLFTFNKQDFNERNMDPPFHCGVESTVTWVVCSGWNLSEMTEKATVIW